MGFYLLNASVAMTVECFFQPPSNVEVLRTTSLQNVSVNTSIFTLIAIALDRYRAIMRPFGKRPTKAGTMASIASIWVASVVLSVPQLIAFRVILVDHSVPQCLPVNISMEAFTW